MSVLAVKIHFTINLSTNPIVFKKYAHTNGNWLIPQSVYILPLVCIKGFKCELSLSIYGTISDPATSKGSSAVTGIEPTRIHTVKRASTQC